MEKILTTLELKKYISGVVDNILPNNKLSDVNLNFAVGSANSLEGTYAFSDNIKYHYLFTEKGQIRFDRTSQQIVDITYWILEDLIFDIALKYATNNREKGEDFRRKLFAKELEIWSLFGEKYYEIKKQDIQATLKDNPYVDK